MVTAVKPLACNLLHVDVILGCFGAYSL